MKPPPITTGPTHRAKASDLWGVSQYDRPRVRVRSVARRLRRAAKRMAKSARMGLKLWLRKHGRVS